MSTHKHIEKLCFMVTALILFLTVLTIYIKSTGSMEAFASVGYENRLFDPSAVHTIDLVMDDWDSFLDTCTNEEYVSCAVIIDGETYRNAAIRAKGNTSLTQTTAYGNGRYSFKIEFDHYDSKNTYHGLDKLCLNNIIQDNTYMKEYLSYQIMAETGAPAPLCSYVSVSVNGEVWGLYLAVEGIEESFLLRNFGNNYGELYKPESSEIGGRAPNGFVPDVSALAKAVDDFPGDTPREKGGLNSLVGSSDVLLQYIDDDPESYSNIFNNAKTDSSNEDQRRLIEALQRLNQGEDLENTLDTDLVIRYFVAHNFVLNFDSYTGTMIHNYYLYEKDGKLSMLPWDYNLAFGGFEAVGSASTLVNYPIDTPVSGGSTDERPMLAWIFSDEHYTELYHQYFSDFISGYFESGRFAETVDSVIEMISPYVEEDPTKFCTYEEFIQGADTLKRFCLLRAQSIRGQIDGTIGLTSDTQNEHTFIDANDLTISDMGSMDVSVGSAPDKTSAPAAPFLDSEPDKAAAPADALGSGPKSPPDIPAQSRLNQPDESDTKLAASLLLTGISVLVLLGGLLFARFFKPRI